MTTSPEEKWKADLTDSNVLIDSNYYMITLVDKNETLNIYECYKKADTLPDPIVGLLGTFNMNHGLIMSDAILWERRKNLTGIVLRGTALNVQMLHF